MGEGEVMKEEKEFAFIWDLLGKYLTFLWDFTGIDWGRFLQWDML